MSDESQYIGRPLRAEETLLLATLLRTPMEILDERLKTSVVEDMADGGMGSIRFWQGCGQSRSFGKAIAEAEYADADGATVSVAVNVDEQGEGPVRNSVCGAKVS